MDDTVIELYQERAQAGHFGPVKPFPRGAGSAITPEVSHCEICDLSFARPRVQADFRQAPLGTAPAFRQ